MTRASAWNAVATTFSFGALAGIIQTAVDPHGWLWEALRALIFVLFVVALALWLTALAKERRSKRGHPPSRSG
jgi:hypothetical protein